MSKTTKMERVGNPFKATFIVITPEMKALGGWATVHKATEVSIPCDSGVPMRKYYTLCGKEFFYQMQSTQEPVNCKSCLKVKG